MDASNSAFCWTSAPANESGDVAPAMGQGSGPKGTPKRAISMIAATMELGKERGLTGDRLRVRNSVGDPMTSVMRNIYLTS